LTTAGPKMLQSKYWFVDSWNVTCKFTKLLNSKVKDQRNGYICSRCERKLTNTIVVLINNYIIDIT